MVDLVGVEPTSRTLLVLLHTTIFKHTHFNHRQLLPSLVADLVCLNMVPQYGIEPHTYRLQGECSTTEL